MNETICYCGHTATEHNGECQRLDCGCPEYVDSLEAASYLSGHHPTTCACEICQKARKAFSLFLKADTSVLIPGEPDQTKYERDALIWMLIDITGEPDANLFAEAIAEIRKLKEIREGATHWAGNAVHFQQEANGLREQLAGKERLIESQREVISKLRSEQWQAHKLLEQIADPEPCHLDHHGHCQTHLWTGKDECAHGRAKKLLGRTRDTTK